MLLWNFRWTIIEICSILFVTLAVTEAMDQHILLFSSYQCNIAVPATAGTQATTAQLQVCGSIHTPAAVFLTSWKLFVFELLLTFAALHSSHVCFIGLLYLLFKQDYFTNLWNITQLLSVSRWCTEQQNTITENCLTSCCMLSNRTTVINLCC